MQTTNIKLTEIKPYPNNAKTHPPEQVKLIVNSIEEFGFQQPLVVDENNEVIIGHGRLMAAKQLKMKELPCVVVTHLSEEQKKAFRIADNKVSESEFDNDALIVEFMELQNMDFDLDLTGFCEMEIDLIMCEQEEDEYSLANSVSLVERFGIPPLSIFDTKQGYWQDRKREWKKILPKGADGREDMPDTVSMAKYARVRDEGASIFDPVLSEIIYKWFCYEGGAILDSFAGGAVRGIVAGFLGYKYTGIDIRKKQVASNKEQIKDMKLPECPEWKTGNSLDIDRHVKEKHDLIFSCPPYFDLEKYSDDENDLSNLKWNEFEIQYTEIIKKTCALLKDDRFACFVVGDIRDKKGAYRNFVDLTKKAFIEAGLVLYNDIVLLEHIGARRMQAARMFNASRKVAKCHQNVLVFYKGDIKKIKENFPKIELPDEEE